MPLIVVVPATLIPYCAYNTPLLTVTFPPTARAALQVIVPLPVLARFPLRVNPLTLPMFPVPPNVKVPLMVLAPPFQFPLGLLIVKL